MSDQNVWYIFDIANCKSSQWATIILYLWHCNYTQRDECPAGVAYSGFFKKISDEVSG